MRNQTGHFPFTLAMQAFGQHLWSLHGARSMLGRHAYEVSKDALFVVRIGRPVAVVLCQWSPAVFPRRPLSLCCQLASYLLVVGAGLRMDEDWSRHVSTFFMSSSMTSGDVESGDADEEATLS